MGRQPMLAHKVETLNDKKGWWVSEKLDGVRALYEAGKFTSRSGHQYTVPADFLIGLPTKPGLILDGELFAGYGSLAVMSGLARRERVEAKEWDGVTFQVFDAIQPKQAQPFEVRQEWAAEAVAQAQQAGNTRVQLIEQKKFTTPARMQQWLDRVMAKGGEGLVLRQPESAYNFGTRSRTFLKWKPKQRAEARIVGYNEGKGVNKGRLGTFQVQLLDSKIEFKLSGKMDAQFREAYQIKNKKWKVKAGYPKIGSLVTFEFMTWTKKGRPREPIYLCERCSRDLS